MHPPEDDVWYPTVDDVLQIHEDIVAEDPEATPGVHDGSRVEFALDYVRGHMGEGPETVHEKAFHLMRLLASNHWFADANKRTALNTTELFYLVNGYELEYGDDVRAMLKLFSVREDLVDRHVGPEYLRDRTDPISVEDFDLGSVLAILLAALADELTDEDLELPDNEGFDASSLREEFGLTTDYGTTVNIGETEPGNEDGG